MIIAEHDGVVLRHAQDEDLPRVDEITIICYTPIHESYVAMLGEECYEAVRHNPELTWEERKTGQVHRLREIHVSAGAELLSPAKATFCACRHRSRSSPYPSEASV